MAGSEAAGAEARRYGRTAGLLSIGVGATGLITYLFFALASHNLERVEYGELVVLWSVVFITVSTLYRPVEQLLSRTIAEREARGRPSGRPLRVAAGIQGALALAFAAAALALRGPLQDGLLSGDETLYWVLVATVAAYSASYFARGFFAGSRRFAMYAALMLFESVSRTCFALAVALGVATGQSAVALGIVAAPLFSLLVVPFAVLRRPGRATVRPDPSPESAEFTLAQGWGFASAVLLIMLSEQILYNAGPLLVRAAEGAAAAGFIFNVLMIARAPLQLFQAVATSLLPHLTRLASAGAGSGAPAGEAAPPGSAAFRLSVRVTVLAIGGFAAFTALVVAAAGPELMQLAFGAKFGYDTVGLLIVTAGMGLYLCAATLNQAALAQGQVRRAAACWVGSAAAFVLFNLTGAFDPFRRVEAGFALAAALLCALLYALYRRPHPRAEDVPLPDSPKELEARLAAADESG